MPTSDVTKSLAPADRMALVVRVLHGGNLSIKNGRGDELVIEPNQYLEICADNRHVRATRRPRSIQQGASSHE